MGVSSALRIPSSEGCNLLHIRSLSNSTNILEALLCARLSGASARRPWVLLPQCPGAVSAAGAAPGALETRLGAGRLQGRAT